MNYGFGGKTLGWARVAKLENMKAFTPSPVQFYQNPKNGLPNHYGHIMSGSEMSRKAIIKIGFLPSWQPVKRRAQRRRVGGGIDPQPTKKEKKQAEI